ncbi:hypothetical protein WJX81_004143 [Elliptochloris bilobata]|uniref:COP9 signalosome complex subunit 6 n=1 Tax=Elliptochloris bilobata TaxID=381761 RepID=A0AAW1S9J2_9CHLO
MDVPKGEEARQSSSGLQFHLHPLVLINISDHATRIRATSGGPSGEVRVLGCLLGQQAGRVVDISNSFELRHELTADGSVMLDDAFLTKKLEQYKQTFAHLDVVGWYASGAAVQETDILIHRRVMAMNESPVFLLMNIKPRQAQKDLPVLLYETELHSVEGMPQFVFVQSKYNVETSEAERIGINQVAKVLPSGNDKGTDQLTAHFTSLHAALMMLTGRLTLLHGLLSKMAAGEVAYDHAIVQQAASLVRRLPAVKTLCFKGDFFTEYSDAMLTVLMTSVTMGAHAVNDIVDKVSIAYDKSRRRGLM